MTPRMAEKEDKMKEQAKEEQATCIYEYMSELQLFGTIGPKK
jgi:hypothetical protein